MFSATLTVLLVGHTALAEPPVDISVPATAQIEIGGRVVSVTGQDVVIARGSSDGLVVGTRVVFSPIRPSPSGGAASLDRDVVLGVGAVSRLEDTRAVVRIERPIEPVETGDYASYDLEVPTSVAEDTLFLVLSSDVLLRRLNTDAPIATLRQLLEGAAAGRSIQELRAPIVEALVAEIRARAELAKEVYKQPIAGGRFHGKSLSDAMAGATAVDVDDFIAFVAAFPGKYIGKTWKFVEVWATWVINRTPDDGGNQLRLATRHHYREARGAVAAGDFARAQNLVRHVLELHPDHPGARELLGDLQKLALSRRKLEEDPQNHSLRFELADALYDRASYTAARTELERLREAGYRPLTVQRYLGYVAVRQERFDDAIELFEAAQKQQSSETTARWLRSARLRKQRAAADDPAAAELQLAEIAEIEEAWDSAQKRYGTVLQTYRTPEQLQKAREGQARTRVIRNLISVRDRIESNLRDHDTSQTAERLERLVSFGKQSGKTGLLDEALDTLAGVARDEYEFATAAAFEERRLVLDPNNAEAAAGLAWIRYLAGQFEPALVAARRAQQLDPEAEYPIHIESRIELARGDVEAAERAARRAARDDEYAWPRTVLARIAVGRGDLDPAEALAKEAMRLEREAGEIRMLWNSVAHLRLADDAIAARRDVQRNRLRRVRALVRIGSWRLARAEIARMKRGPDKQEALWALASTTHQDVPISARHAAAQSARWSSQQRTEYVRFLETQAAWRATPEDPDVLIAASRALTRQGRADEALAVLRELLHAPTPSVADAERQARLLQRADALQARAEKRRLLGHRAASARDYTAARDLYRTVGNDEGAALADFWVAVTAVGKGQTEAAIEALTKRRKELEGRVDYTHLLNFDQALLDLSWTIGKAITRSESADAAFRSCDAHDDDYCAAHNLLRYAGYRSAEGYTEQALAAAERARGLAERTGIASLTRRALFQLADLHLERWRHAEALTHANALLKLARRDEDRASERLALLVIGAISMRRGEGEDALKRFARVYEFAAQDGDNWARAVARRFEGATHLNVTRDYAEAARKFASASAIFGGLGLEQERLDVGGSEGEARSRLKDFDAGRKAFSAAIEAARRQQRNVSLAWLLSGLARLEAGAKRGPEAVAAGREAVDRAKKTDQKSLTWTAHHALGRALEAADDLAAAAVQYEAAVDALSATVSGEEADKVKDFGDTRRIYGDAIDALIRLGRVTRAMEILDRSRDANLRRMFDPSRIKTGSQDVDETLEGLDSARKAAQAARQRLQEEQARPAAEQDAARLERFSERVAASDGKVRQLLMRLKARHTSLYNAIAVDPRSLVNDRESLPRGAVVVAYFNVGEVVYVFVVAREQKAARAFRVDLDGSNLDEVVQRYREALLREDPLAEDLSRQLYRWLLEPVEADLEGAKTVLIMPSGALYYLPFHALLTSGPDEEPRYVLEKHRLAYLSQTTIDEVRRPSRRPRLKRMAAFADPTQDLPGAREELRQVKSRAFPRAEVLVGTKAVKDAVSRRAGKFEIMHFATHGVLDPDPLASHLRMASGKLTVDDIAGLDFARKTHLIVLSACRTALDVGAARRGEGISIAEAFATAGAPALVASLWDVDDEATARLMTGFYERLRKGRGDPLDALRDAQLAVLRHEDGGVRVFEPPLFWAGFELIGDFR